MIIDTPWMPRLVPTADLGGAVAASTAEVTAGTDNAKFITPAALEGADPAFAAGTVPAQIARTVNPRAPAQGLVFDGSAVSATATLSAEVSTSAASVQIKFQCPATNGAANQYLATIGTAFSDEFDVRISTTGDLDVLVFGVSSSDYNRWRYSAFVTAFQGKSVDLVVTRGASGNAVIYINGVDVSSSGTFGTLGTAPTWQGEIDGTSVSFGDSLAAVHSALRIWKRQLSAAEVAILYENNTPFAIATTSLLLAAEAGAPGNGYVWNSAPGVSHTPIVLPSTGASWALPDTRANRIRGTTNTNGNQQLLGASALLPAESQIVRIRARSRSGTPSIAIGTSSGGSQIVSSVALSTTWKNLTIALTDGVVSTADDVWIGSNSTDVVEVDMAWEPLDVIA